MKSKMENEALKILIRKGITKTEIALIESAYDYQSYETARELLLSSPHCNMDTDPLTESEYGLVKEAMAS